MPKPQVADENLVINELIREYLEFNGYRHTLSVFLPETGQPNQPMDRALIADQLSVAEDAASDRVPLIYSVAGIGAARRRRAAPSSMPPAAAGSSGSGGGGVLGSAAGSRSRGVGTSPGRGARQGQQKQSDMEDFSQLSARYGVGAQEGGTINIFN
eukprot:g4679.t1